VVWGKPSFPYPLIVEQPEIRPVRRAVIKARYRYFLKFMSLPLEKFLVYDLLYKIKPNLR
jgi:hypothetical protein